MKAALRMDKITVTGIGAMVKEYCYLRSEFGPTDHGKGSIIRLYLMILTRCSEEPLFYHKGQKILRSQSRKEPYSSVVMLPGTFSMSTIHSRKYHWALCIKGIPAP